MKALRMRIGSGSHLTSYTETHLCLQLLAMNPLAKTAIVLKTIGKAIARYNERAKVTCAKAKLFPTSPHLHSAVDAKLSLYGSQDSLPS